jgi:riboflavin kinase/FMN adenylyltransferase
MIVCRQLEELATLDAPLHLALGVFDGVHVGHQAVIARAVAAAKRDGGLAGVLTFDPHPIRVIAPGKAPSALLATLDHKAQIVEDLGVGLFIALHFDEKFAAREATDFLFSKRRSKPSPWARIGASVMAAMAMWNSFSNNRRCAISRWKPSRR